MGNESSAAVSGRAGYASGLRMLVLLEIAVTVIVSAMAGVIPTPVVLALFGVPVICLIALVLRVQTSLEAPGPLDPQDTRLVSRSGRLGPLMVGMFAIVILGIHLARGGQDTPTGARLRVVQSLMCVAIACAELGVTFALVYIGAPKGFGNDRSQGMWKAVGYAVALPLGFLAVLMASSPLLRPATGPSRKIGVQATPVTTSQARSQPASPAP